MDVRTCELFLTLAETRHFARAASRAAMSPSAVSRHLQRLERAIGQHLVDRDNRQVNLTPAGRRFLDYARKVVDDWQQLKSDLSAGPGALSGEVTVFGSVTASYSMLTRILPAMRERHPGIDVRLRTGDQAEGIERVAGAVDDCAVVARPATLQRRLEFLPLRETPLRLVGPRMPSALTRRIDHAVAAGAEPDWQALPLVLAERGLARERVLQRFRRWRREPRIYAQVAGHEAVISMVALGFGIAVVPQLVIEHSPERERVRVLPWLDDLAPFELGLCALRERLRDPLLNAFWRSAAGAYPQS